MNVTSAIKYRVLRLCFARDNNAGVTTTLGTFANRIIRGNEDFRKVARELAANLLTTERASCIGYCIEDGSFDVFNVPANKVRPL